MAASRDLHCYHQQHQVVKQEQARTSSSQNLPFLWLEEGILSPELILLQIVEIDIPQEWKRLVVLEKASHGCNKYGYL